MVCTYLSSDADSNGSADILNIDADFDQTIDFQLESRPSATVNIQLLDSETSEHVDTLGLISLMRKMSLARLSFQR